MSKEENCIFCKIASKEISSFIINETKNSISFLDVNPKSKGHTLIITKKHYKDLFSINKKCVLKDLIKNLYQTKEILSSKLGTNEFNVLSNIGANAGQEVFHVHIHLIPKYGKNENILQKDVKINLKEIYKEIKGE